MGLHFNLVADEEEDQFFDAREEEISSSAAADSARNSPTNTPICSDEDLMNWVSKPPSSVRDRRDQFMRQMGLDPSSNPLHGSIGDNADAADIGRMTSDDGAVLGCSSSEESDCSIPGWSPVETRAVPGGAAREELDRDFGSSMLVGAEDGSSSSNSDTGSRRTRMKWLRRIGVAAREMSRRGGQKSRRYSYDPECNVDDKLKKVRVRLFQKKYKEFSAVYLGQDIKAHDGGILAMKFSPDGRYLATGGEDGVVRVWRIAERERTDEDDVLEGDPSCVYFKVDHNSELAHLSTSVKGKKGVFRRMKKSSDFACVVLPPNSFLISEEPLHEFHGHTGDVLDLSWSKDERILSSSVDRTVRLWQLGCESCLKVFTHNDYVTSVQFNPVEENCFISGSIDGKIRIWDISRCRVVDWADVREIITAVCYRPDGLGGVVGSIMGNCRFYDASDNQLQLDAVVSLQGRKKSPEKRITGFQFCPDEPRRLMVTSANSRVRILDGVDVICKYKGLRSSGSQTSASFTSDGRHIVSASEDSHVYVWNHSNHTVPAPPHQSKSSKSSERFLSSNVSVAIPWHGVDARIPVPSESEAISVPSSGRAKLAKELEAGNNNLFLSPSGSFSLSGELFSELPSKGSATWPEEKLPSSTLAVAAATASSCNKSQFKFPKTSCRNTSHAWGQVIVTAGWDGRIRSFQNYGLPVAN